MSRIPLRLVVKNLFKHPVRSLLTMGSLTVALFLLCFLRSVVVTLEAGVRSAKTDRLIVQSAVSLFVYLPQSYEGKIRAVEGVEKVCGWNWFGGYYQEPSNFFAQFAVDHKTLLPLYPEIQIEDGSAQAFEGNRRSCVIGADLSRDFGWKVGDSVPIISALFPRVDGEPWNFQVAGIYRSTSSNVDNRTLFFHFDYLEKSLEQESAMGPVGIGIFVLKVRDGFDPLTVMSDIDALFENGPQRVQTTSEAAFQAQFVSMVGNVPFFVSSIGTGVFLAILMAVLNTMLMAAREQTHDVGVLKAMGYSNFSIFLVLLLQSLFLSLLGGGLGVALAQTSSGYFEEVLSSTLPYYQVTLETAFLGGIVSLVIGLLAGLAPAYNLSRLSCVQSLRMEA